MNDLDTFSRGLRCSNYLFLVDIKNLLIRYRIQSNDISTGQLIVANVLFRFAFSDLGGQGLFCYSDTSK